MIVGSGPRIITPPVAATSRYAPPRATSGRGLVGDPAVGLREITRTLRDVEELEALAKKLRTGRPERLGLDTTGNRSTLGSVGQLAAPTTITDLAPTDTAPITTQTGIEGTIHPGFKVRLGGVFTGTAPTTARLYASQTYLSMRDDGLRSGAGTPDFQLSFDGEVVETLSFQNGDLPETTRSFSNGLNVTIGFNDGYSGKANLRRYAWVDFDLTPTGIDPATTFNVEQPTSGTISDGSFSLNGETISVSSADSLNDVLTRINASDAGVVASYDTDERRVTFQRTEDGPLEIEFADDTSGFLAAMGLDTATTNLGDSGDLDRVIDDVTTLAYLQSGSFTVDGTSIAIDTSTDTIRDIIDRINTESTTVNASWDADAGRIKLDGAGASAIADGTSNFASKILDERTTATASARTASAIVDKLNKISDRLEKIEETFGSSFLNGMKAALAKRIGLDSGESTAKSNGMSFDFDVETEDELLRLDARGNKLLQSLTSRPRTMERFLLGENSEDPGFVRELKNALNAAGKNLSARYRVTGFSFTA